MAGLRRRLPPANSLVAFEAAARHQSFTAAAKELAVSQAAVSRHMRILEDFLGAPLFERRQRAVELTPAGQRFQQAVAIGLEHIAGAADDIRHREPPGEITIASSVTFAAYWLMARIAKFRAQHPEVELRMVASARRRDMASRDIDLAIRYGRGEWPEASSHYLFDNEIFPVCSPAYLRRHGPINRVADLLDATFLQLAQFDRNWVTWDAWLERFHARGERRGQSVSFDSYMLLIQAALGGQGVALCGKRLAQDFIDRGELVRPLAASLGSDYAFYLLQSASRPLRPDALRFRDWLIAEARGAGPRER